MKIQEEQIKSDFGGEADKLDLLDVHKKYNFRRYFASQKLDTAVHSGFVERAVYVPHLNLILTVENQSKDIKLYDLDCKLKQRLYPSFVKNGFVMDADYSDSQIGCVGSDSCMYFFEKCDEGWEITKCINAPSIQTRIKYLKLPQHQYWATAGKDHCLRIWDPLLPGSSGSQICQHTGFGDEIMCIVEIEQPLGVACACLDSTIVLYSVMT